MLTRKSSTAYWTPGLCANQSSDAGSVPPHDFTSLSIASTRARMGSGPMRSSFSSLDIAACCPARAHTGCKPLEPPRPGILPSARARTRAPTAAPAAPRTQGTHTPHAPHPGRNAQPQGARGPRAGARAPGHARRDRPITASGMFQNDLLTPPPRSRDRFIARRHSEARGSLAERHRCARLKQRGPAAACAPRPPQWRVRHEPCARLPRRGVGR